MKKVIAIICSALLCLSILVSCNQESTTTYTNPALEYAQVHTEVLEIQMLRWDSVNQHHEDVLEEVITQDESKVDTQKEIIFLDQTYCISYLESHYSEIGDLRFDRYQIQDHSGNSNTVDLHQDGSIKRISGNALSLDLNQYDTTEKVKAALEELLKEEIDLTLYDHFAYSEEEGYHWFNLYNDDGRIIYDYSTHIHVQDSGAITVFWLGDPNYRFENISQNWSIYHFDHAIQEKLNAITQGTSTIKTYSIFDKSLRVVVYKDNYYIRCEVPVTIVTNDDNREINDIWYFLVKIPKEQPTL